MSLHFEFDNFWIIPWEKIPFNVDIWIHVPGAKMGNMCHKFFYNLWKLSKISCFIILSNYTNAEPCYSCVQLTWADHLESPLDRDMWSTTLWSNDHVLGYFSVPEARRGYITSLTTWCPTLYLLLPQPHLKSQSLWTAQSFTAHHLQNIASLSCYYYLIKSRKHHFIFSRKSLSFQQAWSFQYAFSKRLVSFL